MKINLENMHSPCIQCYLRGKSYSPEDEFCQRCEYNIAAYLNNILSSIHPLLTGT